MTEYRPTLKPENAALRDAWMQQFSQDFQIGRIYGNKGAEIQAGRSALGWILEFRILDPTMKPDQYTPQMISHLLISLAVAYNKASSMFSLISMAARTLKNQLESEESSFIDEEMKRYKVGGEYWDPVAKKAPRPPGREVLSSMAKAAYSKLFAMHDRLMLEATFFEHVMANLETQRRCLKEYMEIVRLDPTRMGMNP